MGRTGVRTNRSRAKNRQEDRQSSIKCLDPLTDPRFVIAAILLALNDHKFKAAYGNWLTGKLSDLTGLIVLPIVVAVVLRVVRIRHPERVGFGVVGAWFIAIKVIPAAARFTETAAAAVTGRSSTIVVDATDLIGLAGLVIAGVIVRRPRPVMNHPTFRYAMLGFAVVVCTATSNSGGTATDLYLEDTTGSVEAVSPWGDEVGPDAGDSETVRSGNGLGSFATETCLTASAGGDCFRIVEGRVERESSDGFELEWAVFDTQIVVKHVGGGAGYSPSLRATDIISGPDGTVHVAFDGVAPIVRSSSGQWSPGFSEYRPIAGLVILALLATFGVAMTIAAHNVNRVIWAVLFAVGGVWAHLGGINADALFDGLLAAAGIAGGAVAFVLGLAASWGESEPLDRRRAIAGCIGTALVPLPLLYWKYVVSAPSELMYGSFVMAVAVWLAQLAIPTATRA